MLIYILRRLVIFTPTLLLISLLAFLLSKAAPGDPVELINRGQAPLEEGGAGLMDAEQIYKKTATMLGLDRPVFYFTLTTSAFPDTLYRIINRDQRAMVRSLIWQSGKAREAMPYYQLLRQGLQGAGRLPKSAKAEAIRAQRSLQMLLLQVEPAVMQAQLDTLQHLSVRSPVFRARFQPTVDRLEQHITALTTNPEHWRHYLPKLIWHGADNQYHHWLSGILKGDFGTSYSDGLPVVQKIRNALPVTLLVNGLAILLAYLLSVPLGVYTARERGSQREKSITFGLFLLYSLPNFWIATLLLIFFTTPEYGMDFFPTMGLRSDQVAGGWWNRTLDLLWHLVLPVVCLTYPALAYLSRQMRGGMVNVLDEPYIRTAYAKGLPRRRVIWGHAFRIALFPIITLFGALFPALLAGSVVIESIFNLPGMGKVSIDAIYARDWPVVYGLLLLSALMTMVGILIADLLYTVVDPRVQLSKNYRS